MATLKEQTSAGLLFCADAVELHEHEQRIYSTDSITESTMIQGDRKLNLVEKITVYTLVYLKVIFYMDRYSIIGLGPYINKSFNIGEEGMRHLHDIEIVMFMLASPAIGYMCDRHSRQKMLVYFVAVWAMITLLASVVPTYSFFFFCRGVSGIATAGFSTTAPTIIADVARNELRSMILCAFFCAIPFGAGLGYMLSNKFAQWSGDWRWSLRLLTGLIVLSYAFLEYCVDPKRGEIELAGREGQLATGTSYGEDILFFCTNKSFMILTFANVATTYWTSVLTWLVPKIFLLGMSQLERNNELTSGDVLQNIGLLLILSGIYGVPFGTLMSRLLRPTMPWIDPVICGLGQVASVPFFFLSICVSDSDDQMAYALLFFGEIALNCGWAVFIDMTFYITPPTRRGTAMAMLSFMPDLLGICLGRVVTQSMYEFYTTVDIVNDSEFTCVQLTVLSILPIALFGGLLLLLDGIFIVGDREIANNLLIVETKTTEKT